MREQRNINKHITALSSDGATLAKIIATFSVVFTHSFKLFGYMGIEESEVFYLRGFHAFASCGVPIFFLLSGYFLVLKDNWDYRVNLRKKFKSLVIPYCVFILLYALISCLGSLVLPSFFDDFRKFSALDWFQHLIGVPFDAGPRFYGPLWFIRELIIFNLLAFVLVPVVKKTPDYLLIPAMLVFYFLPLPQLFRYSLPVFMIGMRLGFNKRIPVFNDTRYILIAFAIGFILPAVSLGPLAWKISVLFMAAFILMLSEKLVGNENIRKLAKTAIPFSFPVYLLHEYPITTLMRLLALMRIPLFAAIIAFFIAPFFVIAVCVCITMLWKRCFPRSFAICTGGR